MKNVIVLFCLLPLTFVAGLTGMRAQIVEIVVDNQRIEGNTFHFDIFLRNHGPNDYYLGECDFMLHYNHQFFGNFEPEAKSATTGNMEAYDLNARILENNILMVELWAPEIGNENEFSRRVEVLPPDRSMVFIGTASVPGIIDPNGTMGLRWANEGLFKSYLSQFELVEPWLIEELDNEAQCSDPFDYPLTGAVTGTAVDERREARATSALKVYPQPAGLLCTIEVPAEENSAISLRLVSPDGRIVLKTRASLTNGRVLLQLPTSLGTGVYRAHIRSMRDNRTLGTATILVVR